jgi:hypothetical protein
MTQFAGKLKSKIKDHRISNKTEFSGLKIDLIRKKNFGVPYGYDFFMQILAIFVGKAFKIKKFIILFIIIVDFHFSECVNTT